jgi:hypothetical protein
MTDLSPEDLLDLDRKLADPVWRLCHLYEVKDAKTGRMVPFVPSEEQLAIIHAVHIRGERAILILKARQLGMSTVINLILADEAIWSEGFQGSIVDQTQGDATLKLRHKVKAAFESMPDLLKESFEVVKANDSEFAVRMKGARVDQTSTIFGGMNARGGTNQMLHISEWGPIQHKDPVRSEEIMTGALPSAKEGVVFIETTWMGGKRGHLWNLTDRAMTTRPEDMTVADFHLYFFPWWRDPAYSLEGNAAQIDAETTAYFITKSAETGHVFTPGQMLWYYKVALPKGLARFAEFPTTLDECFMAPVPGAIFARFVDKAKAEGRVINFPWDRSNLVHTSWDLGSPKNTRTVYFQFVGREIHVIDHDTGLDLEPAGRVSHMLGKGYNLGTHYFPHDAAAQEKSGKNFEQQMREAGLENIRIVPRCREIWPGINKAAELFPRCVFHKDKCASLLESLECYHTKEERTSGHQTSIPVHDWSSHDADAFRMMAEAILNGLAKGHAEILRDARPANQRQTKASAGRYSRR